MTFQNATLSVLAVSRQERHWALQHEAMESLLLYVRSPKSGDFKQVLPKSLYNPGKLASCLTCFLCPTQISAAKIQGLKRCHTVMTDCRVE